MAFTAGEPFSPASDVLITLIADEVGLGTTYVKAKDPIFKATTFHRDM